MKPSTTPRFSNWQLRALARAVPLTASLELTNRCNLRCGFCCNRRPYDRDPLTAAEWRGLLGDLRCLGTLFVTLTGGEPLVHPGFFQIAEAARDLALAIRILTNGTLIDDRSADRIALMQPLSVELSLHGAVASTHDDTTCIPGSHAALWAAVDRLLERQVSVVLKTPITLTNLAEIDEIIDLTQKRDIPLLVDPTITPRDNGDRRTLGHAIDGSMPDELYRILDRWNRLPETQRVRGGANCGLGRLTLTVDPNGEVFPCILWRTSSYGNVRNQSLAEIWKGRERAEAAAISRQANDTLFDLDEPLSSFPFCPALAARDGGNPTLPYDQFRKHAEASFRARGTGGSNSLPSRHQELLPLRS